MITREEILRRARAVPQKSDDYSQSRLDGDGPNAGYRPDCSGFVSYCWGCPTAGPGTWGGYSTASFVTVAFAPGKPGIMYEIPRSELQPGDAIGHCTPTSGGNDGHIALWLGKSGSKEHILDHGGGMGPLDHTVTWGTGSGWNAANKIKAFRFRGVEGSPSGGVPPMTPATIPAGAPFPLASGHYYGDIKGPNESHGGFYPDELPNIAAIQLKLIALGYVPGITAGTAQAADWADGVYEGPTTEAVKRLQAAAGLEPTGNVGPKTWAALFPAAPQPPAPDPTTPLPPAGVDVAALAKMLLPLMLPEILAAIPKGPAGERGPAGPVGERGPRGENGPVGALLVGTKLIVAPE